MSAVVVALVALAVTKVVDTVRNGLDPQGSFPKVTWNLLAFGLGIFLAVTYQVNLLAQLGTADLQGTAGQVITGLLIASGGSGWHELLDLASSKAKLARRG